MRCVVHHKVRCFKWARREIGGIWTEVEMSQYERSVHSISLLPICLGQLRILQIFQQWRNFHFNHSLGPCSVIAALNKEMGFVITYSKINYLERIFQAKDAFLQGLFHGACIIGILDYLLDFAQHVGHFVQQHVGQLPGIQMEIGAPEEQLKFTFCIFPPFFSGNLDHRKGWRRVPGDIGKPLHFVVEQSIIDGQIAHNRIPFNVAFVCVTQILKIKIY